MARYSRPGQIVLDPMAGGTVNVEALLTGRPSIAVDVDPFARLLTRVKTTPSIPAGCTLCGTPSWPRSRPSKAPGAGRAEAMAHVPHFAYRESWFRPFILEELGALRRAIGEAGDGAPDGVRRLLPHLPLVDRARRLQRGQQLHPHRRPPAPQQAHRPRNGAAPLFGVVDVNVGRMGPSRPSVPRTSR